MLGVRTRLRCTKHIPYRWLRRVAQLVIVLIIVSTLLRGLMRDESHEISRKEKYANYQAMVATEKERSKSHDTSIDVGQEKFMEHEISVAIPIKRNESHEIFREGQFTKKQSSVAPLKKRNEFDEIFVYRRERYLKYQASAATRKGPGEHGAGVKLSEEEEKKFTATNLKEGFNFGASELIALDRSVPDYRSKDCKQRVYPKDLPKASVILVYHNEAPSVILRTAHSVVNRSPPEYLEEVMLLDDSSTRPDVLKPMFTYIDTTWPDGIVHVVKTPERYGLIRAKVHGGRAAKGPVLIYLDAHCEVGPGWLEPILNEILEDDTRVICPSIGNIQLGDLTYHSAGGSIRGGFTWAMHFTWEARADSERKQSKGVAHAFPSPTMAGGLFAIHKEFFFRIGAYDEKLEIWGGENLELSFKTWMCGGALLFHPCSQVGHIFRPTHPYGFPDRKRDYHGLNSKRVAEVWMDDYKRYFYFHRKGLENADVGDLSEMKAIREREKCKSFDWYLNTVYPEKFKLDVNVTAFGSVRNKATSKCFDSLDHSEKSTYVPGVYRCYKDLSAMSQTFSLTPSGLIRREGTCLTYHKSTGEIKMKTRCDPSENEQIWIYKKDKGQIIHKETWRCVDGAGLNDKSFLKLRPCDGSATQTWEWTYYYGSPDK